MTHPATIERDFIREAPDAARRDLVCRTLHVRAGTINEEDRSIEAVLSTEAVTTVFDWEHYRLIDEVLISRGAELPAQIIMLDDHMRWSNEFVLGSIRSMRVDAAQIVGRLHFARGDERAEKVWNKVAQGHITDVSVGYRALPGGFVDIPPGGTQTVQGKTYTARERTLRITTRWRPKEGSITPIGADEAAKIIRAAGTGTRTQPHGGGVESNVMNPKLRKYLENLGLRTDATTAEAFKFLEGLSGTHRTDADALLTPGQGENTPPAAPATPPAADPTRSAPPAAPAPAPAAPAPQPAAAPAPAAADTDAVRQETIRAERERVRSIRRLGGDDTPAELVTRAIDEGWTTERASAEFLARLREGRPSASGNAPAVIVRSNEQNLTRDALTMGLHRRLGIPWQIAADATDVERAAFERTQDQADQLNIHHAMDMCREALRLDNQRIPHTRDEMIRAATSTGSLQYAFASTVGRRLEAGFEEAPDSTQGWCQDVEVNDFRTNTAVLLGKTAVPKKLPRGKTADHVSISDEAETYSIARYAEQFVVDDQDFIDDDLGVINEMPYEMGRGCGQLRPDLVYGTVHANANMRDGIALFDAATHKNYGTSGSALAASTLQTAIIAMAKQTFGGRNLNLSPRYIITPQDLRFDVEILLKSVQRIIASASGGTLNPLANLGIEPRYDNRMGVAGVTNPATGTTHAGLATNYLLAADPVAGKGIRVAYRSGTGRAPTMRMFVLDRGQWGFGFDIKMDIGVKAISWHGLYFATGAS